MAIQATVETQSIYHVVGMRVSGERVEITETADVAVAEKVVSLMWGSVNYSDIFIECDGKRLALHCDGDRAFLV